ncbi:MAG TPA: NeuD/PglB/VioB family sugar acetyltransferase [Salinimicrobium sp.]|nr:NeuD/PglB/VioB family sugar acetyltransferase [Salinimicrobium sp.]
MKEDVIILGKGGHAKTIIDMIEEQGIYNIVGVTDYEVSEAEFAGYPVLGTDDVLPGYFKKGVKNAVIGVGGFRNNDLRIKLFNRAKKVGFNLPVIVHHSAIVSKTSKIGEGTVIKRGAIVDTDVTIGKNNVLELGSTVGHESKVGDHVLISANSIVSAYDIIEDDVFLAVSSTIISGLKVCSGTLIGAGSVVVKDIEQPGTYFGLPAKLITK